jgi:hypothetical protein
MDMRGLKVGEPLPRYGVCVYQVDGPAGGTSGVVIVLKEFNFVLVVLTPAPELLFLGE